MALEAPGTDFHKTLESIFYLRNCEPSKHNIRKYVTFHLFFDNKHVPRKLNKDFQALENRYKCPKSPPNQKLEPSYRKSHNLNYHINVARNLAKKSALTYFVFPSDVELYPNPGLIPQFFDMIVKNLSLIHNGNK